MHLFVFGLVAYNGDCRGIDMLFGMAANVNAYGMRIRGPKLNACPPGASEAGTIRDGLGCHACLERLNGASRNLRPNLLRNCTRGRNGNRELKTRTQRCHLIVLRFNVAGNMVSHYLKSFVKLFGVHEF